MSGHHAEHVGLQKHSVGDLYPLAVVGYGNGDDTLYVIEHLTDGTVLCDGAGSPYQSDAYAVLPGIAESGFDQALDLWVKGRPYYNGNRMVM